MTLLPVHRSFLIINQVIISTVFNLFLNLGIAWFFYRHMQQVPLWGALSIGFDTLATAFVLPLLTCYSIVLSIWFSIKKGWMPIIADFPKTGVVGAFIRKPVVVQGILFGLAGMLLFGVPVIAWFVIAGRPALSISAFLVFKALFAALLSLAVSPVIGLFALFGDEPRKQKIALQ